MLGVLTEIELIELTGRKRRSGQIKELTAMGFLFVVRSDGSIAVARAHVAHRMGIMQQAAGARHVPELRL